MPDGGEERGAHPVCGLQMRGFLSSGGQAPTLESGRRRLREGPQNPLVLAEKRWAAYEQNEPGIHLEPEFHLVPRGCRRIGDSFHLRPGSVVVFERATSRRRTQSEFAPAVRERLHLSECGTRERG